MEGASLPHRSPRIPFEHPVHLEPLEGQGSLTKYAVENLSEGGMFVLDDEGRFPEGTRVSVRMESNGKPLPFAEAIVVWRRPPGFKGSISGFGLQFSRFLNPRAQNLLRGLIERVSERANREAVKASAVPSRANLSAARASFAPGAGPGVPAAQMSFPPTYIAQPAPPSMSMPPMHASMPPSHAGAQAHGQPAWESQLGGGMPQQPPGMSFAPAGHGHAYGHVGASMPMHPGMGMSAPVMMGQPPPSAFGRGHADSGIEDSFPPEEFVDEDGEGEDVELEADGANEAHDDEDTRRIRQIQSLALTVLIAAAVGALVLFRGGKSDEEPASTGEETEIAAANGNDVGFEEAPPAPETLRAPNGAPQVIIEDGNGGEVRMEPARPPVREVSPPRAPLGSPVAAAADTGGLDTTDADDATGETAALEKPRFKYYAGKNEDEAGEDAALTPIADGQLSAPVPGGTVVPAQTGTPVAKPATVAAAPVAKPTPTPAPAATAVAAAAAKPAPAVAAPSKPVAAPTATLAATSVKPAAPKPAPVAAAKPGKSVTKKFSGNVEQVQVSTTGSGIQVTPKLGRGARVERAFLLTGPSRLVVDLAGPQPTKNVTESLGNLEGVRSVRLGARPGGTRLVVDLTRPAKKAETKGSNISVRF